jgi:hypothetical protein
MIMNEIVTSKPRKRNDDRFKELVRSISDIGLQKPICVGKSNCMDNPICISLLFSSVIPLQNKKETQR